MSKLINLTIRLFVVLPLIPLATQADSLENTRPNIIFVMTDDQGMGDLSCTGNPILKTPRIDSFYEQSTRFTDFQVSPTCAPTRAAIMSGRAPFRVGVTHTIFQRERLSLDVYTMPQALQSAGYATGLFGKWHLGDEEEYLPQSRGFDEVLMHGSGGIGQLHLGDFPTNEVNAYFDSVLLHNETIVKSKGFCTDVFFEASLAWIKKQHESEKPYFAYISTNAPHAPFLAPDKYKKRFIDAGYDEKSAARYGMIENIDDNFGILMDKLEEWNALENTLVIFMTDNGMSMPSFTVNGEKQIPYNAGLKSYKNSPDEGGTRVPSFWYWKGKLSEGNDVSALATHLDIYKTFADITGVKLPSEMQPLEGRSLIPLLEDANAEWEDRELFIHSGRWHAGDRDNAKYKKCAVRTQRWRFVDNAKLYDISKDRGQKKDVSAEYPEVVETLRKSYDQWWMESKPLMVNEDLPTVKVEAMPLAIRYHKQLAEKGIPAYLPEAF
ncbi:arylsulfatase [Akkermansiaceae bacterium]|nr:arylsulfatase [Akkermansiaceae bacterium]